jgi:hypothetical protein
MIVRNGINGEAMIDRFMQLFEKWGYVDRNLMLNNIVDEEMERHKRKASAARDRQT